MIRFSSNKETAMTHINVIYRATGLLACLVFLHGCAAATVIRKQPDFDNEQQQHLMHTFQPETVALGASDTFSR